jgi:hypothetical protein
MYYFYIFSMSFSSFPWGVFSHYFCNLFLDFVEENLPIRDFNNFLTRIGLIFSSRENFFPQIILIVRNFSCFIESRPQWMHDQATALDLLQLGPSPNLPPVHSTHEAAQRQPSLDFKKNDFCKKKLFN